MILQIGISDFNNVYAKYSVNWFTVKGNKI